MSSHLHHVLLLLVAATAGTLQAQVDRGAELKTKILAEWQSLVDTIQSAQWEERIENQSAPDPRHLRRTSATRMKRVYKNNTGTLSFWDHEGFEDSNAPQKVTDQRTTISLTNPRYGAELSRAKGNGGWVVNELGQTGEEMKERMGQETPCPWLEVAYIRLDQLLREPSFVFTRVEELPGQPSPGLLRAFFTHNQAKAGPARSFKSGHIDFDAARFYRPMKYQFRVKNAKVTDGIQTGTLEYEDGDGIPVLKKWNSEGNYKLVPYQGVQNPTLAGKELHTYFNVEYNGKVNEEEFRLSYYGLPEPQGVVWEKASRWWIWFGILAVACLAVGAYFRRRVRRRKTAVA